LFDYFAGAILMNGLAAMVIFLSPSGLLSIPLWFFAAGVSAYLVCRRATKQHLIVGIKTAAVSIVLGVVMIPTFSTLEISQIITVLICYFVGSVVGAYYALKQQLRIEKPTTLTPPAAEL
jgi:uncharacterized membrane protein YoaK (UPF0700 family)